MTRRNPYEARASDAMRGLIAKGFHAEAMLVSHAAEVLGGSDEAKLTSQLVFDRQFKVMGAV